MLLVTVLVANTLFEGLVGLLLTISPQSAAAAGNAAAISFATNYDFGALTIASVIARCWRYRDTVYTIGVVLGLLSTFHSGLTIATAMSITADGSPVASMV